MLKTRLCRLLLHVNYFSMKINKEGYKIILNSALLLLAGYLGVYFGCRGVAHHFVFCALGVVVILFWLFIVMFFREPKRERLNDESSIFSPADGTIVAIEQVFESEYLKKEVLQVSVFMSVTNVHVNWYPISGVVDYYQYHPGKFLVAWHPKSSEENERTTTVVNTGKHQILFRQIAGFVARRIVNYVDAENTLKVTQNTKFGFIKFGSRIDLFLPLDSEILVKMGEKVVGSQTKIAKLK